MNPKYCSRLANRFLGSIAGLLAASGLGGCIAQDIYDEIVLSNARMEKTHTVLVDIREDLQAVKTTNEQLIVLESRLAPLVDLERLQSINESLTHIDHHLEALRGTIENIDSTIPFLSFSDDPEEESDAAEVEPGTGEAGGADDGPPPADPDGTEAGSAAETGRGDVSAGRGRVPGGRRR